MPLETEELVGGREQAFACGPRDIPRERFTSRAFLEREYDRLFSRTWQIACRVEELRMPGDYVEYVVGDRTAIVLRDGAGRIRAVLNTCPHRGTRLASGCGRFGAEIRCPYHGWRWTLDGRNSFVLDPHEFDHVAGADFDLRAIACDVWGGFVFVNFTPDPQPLLDYLQPLPSIVDPYYPERMRLTGMKQVVLPCNWKIVIDAFNEGYHLLGTHPEMLQWKDDAALKYRPLERHTVYGGAGNPEPSPRLGIDPEDVDQSELLALKIDDLIRAMPGYFTDDDLLALEELKRTQLPDGVSAGAYYLKRRRDGAAARGLDWSHLNDDQVVGGDVPLFFPNMLGPIVGGGWFAYRARPNGWDPASCIFDLWTMEEFPEGAEERPLPKRQVIPDPLAHDFGVVLNQDFANFEAMQKGLSVPGGPGLVWNRRQESCVRRFHEIVDAYLFGDIAGAA